VSRENENESLSQSRPEISAVEAALAQLRPRREARFADEVKGRLKEALSGKTPSSEEVTTTVRIPLTHYIRIAQFNAAAGGLLVGFLLGVLLGAAGVYFALGQFATRPSQPPQSTHTARSPYVRMLLEHDASLTPLERALLDQLDQESHHGRRQVESGTVGREPRNADRS
jgi:hypothetical protein